MNLSQSKFSRTTHKHKRSHTCQHQHQHHHTRQQTLRQEVPQAWRAEIESCKRKLARLVQYLLSLYSGVHETARENRLRITPVVQCSYEIAIRIATPFHHLSRSSQAAHARALGNAGR